MTDETGRPPGGSPDAGWLAESHEPGLVSVITPAYNRVGMLVEAARSVLEQSYESVEMIVVDDGSDQDIEGALRDFTKGESSRKIRFFRQEHLGGQRARNRGMSESCGEFIQFLDSDDLLHPEKSARQVAVLRARPELDFTVSNRVFFTRADLLPPPPEMSYTGPITLESFFSGHSFGTVAPLFRREALRRLGPWDESLACGQEGNYYGRVLAHGLKAEYVPEALGYTREHDQNMSRTMDWMLTVSGLAKAFEGVCREAERLGVAVPDALNRRMLGYRSRHRANTGDTKAALADLKGASALPVPGRVRIELLARRAALVLLRARLYSALCNLVGGAKRRAAKVAKEEGKP